MLADERLSGFVHPPADALSRWEASAAAVPAHVSAVSCEAEAGAAFLSACAEVVAGRCSAAAAAVKAGRAVVAKAGALRVRLESPLTDTPRIEGSGDVESRAIARGRSKVWRAALRGDMKAFGDAFAAVASALVCRPPPEGAVAVKSGSPSVPLSADRSVIRALVVEDHQMACELLAEERKRQARLGT